MTMSTFWWLQVGASDSDGEADTPEEAQRIQAAAESIDQDQPVDPSRDSSPEPTADIQVGKRTYTGPEF